MSENRLSSTGFRRRKSNCERYSGTTRDAIDTFVENEHGKFVFIDTAGIRRQSKINEKIENTVS